MTLGKALALSMLEADFKDEHIAVAISVSAHSVGQWRLGHKQPNRKSYDSLRRLMPMFAKRMDTTAEVAA